MKIKTIIGWVLQIPLYLLVIGSFGASIYAAYNKIQNIGWTTPAIMGGIIVVFLIGTWLKKMDRKEPYEPYEKGYNEEPVVDTENRTNLI